MKFKFLQFIPVLCNASLVVAFLAPTDMVCSGCQLDIGVDISS
jgi:hypothetical protein